MSALAEWVLSAALFFAPVETRPKVAGYEETADEARARYASIAEDIAAAAEEGAPPAGEAKRRAALLLAVAVGESGLSYDVDKGPCYRKGNWRERCDGGTSFTIWQLKAVSIDGEHRHARHVEGVAKRKIAAKAALRKILGSLGMCKSLAPEDRLSAYGAGRCLEGHKGIRARWALFQRVLGHGTDKP
jgi:hypothetical protein